MSALAFWCRIRGHEWKAGVIDGIACTRCGEPFIETTTPKHRK